MKATNNNQIEPSIVIIKHFRITTNNPEDFVEELEIICNKHALDGDFYFTFKIE